MSNLIKTMWSSSESVFIPFSHERPLPANIHFDDVLHCFQTIIENSGKGIGPIQWVFPMKSDNYMTFLFYISRSKHQMLHFSFDLRYTETFPVHLDCHNILTPKPELCFPHCSLVLYHLFSIIRWASISRTIRVTYQPD